MKRLLAAIAFTLSAVGANAAIINVDLSGASSGTSIVAPGASFAGTFAGQAADGSGAPTGPLTLAPSNNLRVEFFLGSNSILPEPGNQGPLSILLDQVADEITFRAGSADAGSILNINFFDAMGTLVGSASQILNAGYDNYTFDSVGDFAGLTILANDDASGLRFQDISYNAIDAAPIPLPAGSLLLITGVGAIAFARKKRAA